MTSGPRWWVGHERFSTVLRPAIMAQAHGWHTESAFMLATFLCPKCGRKLARSGDVEVEGTTFPVRQCDECTTPWTVDGEAFDTAFTFAVDAKGKPFDPASDDGELAP
jgi:hypothetical protein